MGISAESAVAGTLTKARDSVRPEARPEGRRLELVVEPFHRKIVEGEIVRIGSHPSNDVVVDDPRVSLFHCRIELSGDRWVVRDEGSRGGTVLDGVTVRDADLVVPTSHLGIGGTTIRITVLDGAEPATLPRLRAAGQKSAGKR